MMRILQSHWTAASVGAVVYLATLVAAWRPSVTPPEPEITQVAARSPGPSWTFQNPEADLLISELKKQKDALGAKEKDLNELATRLEAERAELNLLTKSVQQVQADFDVNVTRVHEEETANLKKLAKTYATMTPEGAAAVFKALDDSTVVKVLTFMKEADTAAVLEALAKQGDAQAKRVAAISERLRLALPETKKSASS
jgi:flagellar motility protein MotE (MotC chaperone)